MERRDANGFTDVEARAVSRVLVRNHGPRCGISDGYQIVNEALSGEGLTQNDVLAIQALVHHAVFMGDKPDHAEVGRIVCDRILAYALSCADVERAELDLDVIANERRIYGDAA